MVDVGEKTSTQRTAIAEGFVAMTAVALRAATHGTAKKGDVLSVARVAGIMAAKRTSDLIPLCHPLTITNATIDFVTQDEPPGVRVRAEVRVQGQTGVEMEALTAVAVACLTIYDMLKAVEKTIRIEGIHLVTKTGGKSGDFHAPTTSI